MMMPLIANLGPLFRLLSDLNLLNTLAALIIVAAASGQIFAIFVLRNFVADIPQDLFEAAEIDGANHFRQIMAGYAFASIPVILLFIFSMKLFVRGLTEGAVKG